MSVEILDVGPCKKLVKVGVTQERVRQELQKSYQRIQQTITLKGFRRGRVPLKLLERRFGKDIEREVEQTLIQETLSEAIHESKLQPIGEPRLDEEKRSFDVGQDPALSYEVTIQVRPEFDVPDLEGIRVVRPSAAVADEDVERSLESSQQMRAKVTAKEGEDATVGPKDVVIAEVSYLAGGETLRTEEKATVFVGEGRVGPVKVDDLAALLEGKKVDDTVEASCELPPALGAPEGAEQAVRLTVKEIHGLELPALDDAFAKEAGFETVDEMKEEVRRRLIQQKEREAEGKVDERVVEALLERVDFPVPDEVVDKELDDLAFRAMMRARYEGRSDEEAAQLGGSLRQGSRDEVVRSLKAMFLLDKIATEQKIFATEDDVEEAVRSMAARHGATPDKIRGELAERDQLSRLRYDIRLDKTRRFLRDKAEVVDEENR